MKMTNQAQARTARRAEMIALAKEIRREFAKIHSCMDQILRGASLKKAA